MTAQAKMRCGGGWARIAVVMTGAWLRDKLPQASVFFFHSSLVGFKEGIGLYFDVKLSNRPVAHTSAPMEDNFLPYQTTGCNSVRLKID